MNMEASIRTRGLAGPVMNARAGFGDPSGWSDGQGNPIPGRTAEEQRAAAEALRRVQNTASTESRGRQAAWWLTAPIRPNKSAPRMSEKGWGFSNPPSMSNVNLGGKPLICTPAFECENEGRTRYVREQYQNLYGVAAPPDFLNRVISSDFYSKDSLYGMVVQNPPAGGAPVPIEVAAQPGSSGSPANRSTIDTPNPFPAGTGLAPGSSNVTPGGVQFRDGTNPPAAPATGPLGLPAMIFGYPTTTVLGAGAALLVAIAVALAYTSKRGRRR